MKKLPFNFNRTLLALGVLVIIAAAAWTMASHPGRVQANLPPYPWSLPTMSEFPISGMAWSDMPDPNDEVLNPSGIIVGRGAGWIGFANQVPYDDITMLPRFDVNGWLHGYVWTPNMGWIRLDPPGPYPAPPTVPSTTFPGPGRINLVVDIYTGQVTGTGKWDGFARACAVYQSGCSGALKPLYGTELGGWDGWIALSGTAKNGVPFGWVSDIANPTNGGATTGFAWGHHIMGWIQAGVGIFGQDMCTNLPGFQVGVPVGAQIADPFDFSCTYPVTPLDLCVDIAGDQDVSYLQQNGIIVNPVTDPLTGAGNCVTLDYCANLPGNQDQAWLQANPDYIWDSSTNSCTKVPNPSDVSVQLDSNQTINCANDSALLTWTAANATSCTATGGFGFSGTVNSQSDSVSVSGMTDISNQFTISCAGPGGPATSSVIVQCTQGPTLEVCGNGVDDDGDDLVGTTPTGVFIDEGCPGTIYPGGGINPIYKEI
jgi:hypothetical protein